MSLQRDETRTKMVCTLGPASSDEKTIRLLIRAGMNMARLNCSHGEQDERARTIAIIRRVADEEDANIAILADLQGPKLRVGQLDPDPLPLGEGQKVVFSPDLVQGAATWIPLPHPDLIAELSPGDLVRLDDGAIEMLIDHRCCGQASGVVRIGGSLRSHVGISAVCCSTTTPSKISVLTEKDRRDAEHALRHGVDFLALSFVRRPEDIVALRELVKQQTGHASTVGIIAKIEKREALERMEEILPTVDGIMVARGDLGVEVSVQEVPYHQKRIIRLCNRVGIPVITATQMLQSMVTQPRPTRAEASDVANAVLDGTDAVMLSAETAIGAYPVRSAEMLTEIAQMTETRLLAWEDPFPFHSINHEQPITDAISDATVRVAEEIDAKLIVTSTCSGYTARQIARERPNIPIVAVTPNPDIRRRLALSWGVEAFVIPETATTEQLIAQTNRMVIDAHLADPGDLIVLTGGFPVGGGGRTNFLRVHRLTE